MSEDLDYALALSLQEQFKREREEEERGKNRGKSDSAGDLMRDRWDPRLIVDERWELLDPHPNIHDLFVQFDAMLFERRLVGAGVEVRWSPRMTLCAGVCSYEGRGGLCSVRLSVPLLKLRPRKDLVETLLHEMIHALLFVTERNTDHDGHGPNFRAHMKRINSLTGANITVYHTFHQEVRQYRQHWWRCNGPCRDRPPFYGWVKRAMNRAPSPRDPWWRNHQLTCGGAYTKVKEPEGYGKKAATKKTKVEGNKLHSSKDIQKMLTGGGEGGESVSKLRKGKSRSSIGGGKVFSGEGHTLATPPPSRENEPNSKSERRQKLLEAVEKRRQLAQSKGIKRKSGGRSPGDLRDFYPTSESQSPTGRKRPKLENPTSPSNGIVAASTSNLPSSSRDIPSSYLNSCPGPSSMWQEASSGTAGEEEGVVCGTDDTGDVVVIDDDSDGESGDGGRVPLGMCPVCGRVDIPHDIINSHVACCLEEDPQEMVY